MPRRDPPVEYSDAVAVVSPPYKFDLDMLIAIFYSDGDSLQRDYDRAVKWRLIPGLRARDRTAYLEKDLSNRAYVTLGWRSIPYPDPAKPNKCVLPSESPLERIAVPILYGGRNRGTFTKNLKLAESVRVIFHQVDFHNRHDLPRRVQLLLQGRLWCAEGTEQIELVGVSVFGRLIRPGGGCPMQIA